MLAIADERKAQDAPQHGPSKRPRAMSEDVLIDKMFQYQKLLQQKFTEDIGKLDDLKQSKSCRICFIGENDQDSKSKKTDAAKNPLITPCDCSGSSRYIHLDCLKQWLQSKMVVINRFFCDNYIFKVNACELCKAIYPDQVLIDGHKYDIYDIERPETDPYLIMEVVGMPVGKNIKLIKIGKDFNISLGRGEDSDVRVNDSSISQKHASLRFE